MVGSTGYGYRYNADKRKKWTVDGRGLTAISVDSKGQPYGVVSSGNVYHRQGYWRWKLLKGVKAVDVAVGGSKDTVWYLNKNNVKSSSSDKPCTKKKRGSGAPRVIKKNAAIPAGYRLAKYEDLAKDWRLKWKIVAKLPWWGIAALEKGKVDGRGYGGKIHKSRGKECCGVKVVVPADVCDVPSCYSVWSPTSGQDKAKVCGSKISVNNKGEPVVVGEDDRIYERSWGSAGPKWTALGTLKAKDVAASISGSIYAVQKSNGHVMQWHAAGNTWVHISGAATVIDASKDKPVVIGLRKDIWFAK